MDKTDKDVSDLKTQISKLTTSLAIQEKGKFPSQPLANPRGQAMVINEGESSERVEELKPITILRSGKEINKTIVPKAQKPVDIPKSTQVEGVDHRRKPYKIGNMNRVISTDSKEEECFECHGYGH